MPFEVTLVLIVAIVAFSRIWRERYRSRGRDFQSFGPQLDQPTLQSPRVNELEREVSDLRERLEVLERIATEDRKTRQLADEIDRLR